MDNRQFIKALSKATGKSAKDTELLLTDFMAVFRERITDMDTIAIPGFGSFETKKRAERVTTHPSTQQRIIIPPKIVMNFKMSNVLKQRMRDDNKQ